MVPWLCALLGVAVAPALATLTEWLPGSRPRAAHWWYGCGAEKRRIAAITVASAIVAAIVGWRIGSTWVLPAYLGAGVAGIALAVIDWETYRLPNSIVFPLYVWCATWLTIASAATGDWAALLRSAACGAALAGFGLLVAFLNPGRFGLGDCKLLGVLGGLLGWLGWWVAFYGLLAGFLIGAVWSVGIVVLRGRRPGVQFAFGPSLFLGAFIALILV
jgi:leader peptidase (prepilin peptidase)/N-methyltransferase